MTYAALGEDIILRGDPDYFETTDGLTIIARF